MHEQISLWEFSDNKYRITKPIRLIQLFSGIGMQELGIKRIFPNLENYKTCEWAVPSILAYDILHFDKREREVKPLMKIYSNLVWEVIRLLKETSNKPQILLMENVPQVHSKDNMTEFQKVMDELTLLGYSNHWEDMNAKNYGIP